MMHRQIDGDCPAQRMSVDNGLPWIDAALSEQILPDRLGILVNMGFTGRSRALAETAIIRQQHVVAQLMQTLSLIQIVADIPIIAVKI